ncbi:MAG: hypothetical protein E7F68_06490 [Clostridium butyricum]|nr:hypothetical protein [Clostridium butyricum]MDU3594733.1 hypothetical protein [Clostridium butyricum]
MNNLEILNQKDVKIKSNELVDIINEFRKIEGKSELLHFTFMRSIRKEIETLEKLNLNGTYNFVLSSYINSQNKEQPCYELTAKGMRMMLNAESTLVRYKTEEYIESLENRVIELQEQNQKLILEAKERTILRLESENQKVSKVLQADRYIKSEMYGEETYITSIVINILKKCVTKKSILKYTGETYFINESPVKNEFIKYKIKDSEFKRYIEYFGGCKTRIKCNARGGKYNIPIECYSIPSFIIDWDMKDSLKRLD